MNSLSWVRGINATLGRVAPTWAAQRMRQLFVTPNEYAPRDWELPLLASSERVTLRFGLSALRWGEGPAVLLMHGWEGRPTQFATLIEKLVGAGYGVIALDGPGHGRSPGHEADIVLFARALLEAASELPPLRAVIGHSMGGASALLATQMGLRTETLVTIGAPSNVLGVLRGFSRMVGLAPLARSRFIRMIEARAGIAAKQLDVARYELDFPGLVVHAEDDRYVRVGEAAAIHEAWPRSRLLRLKDGGHHRVLADAVVTEAILELLEEVEMPLPLALAS
ncbi:alpha/beta fold hydrolase [Pseudomonas denitrificans (nom. rej.)]|uniref:Alpha/beta hydrolase n=1 Tax=Pseudomonas denitrificans TaxID=43306 RepID=A0A9X7N0K5_PSEDE|nr:alpha/beta fold hydrolase [Pseudomonas denitrificans (nom. rej.)]QEY72660.1 alpha/beta hydrolase [Pseudomonas denitrificans (nom. rej.)]